MLNINTKDIAMNTDYFSSMFNYSTNKGLSIIVTSNNLTPKETLAQNFGGNSPVNSTPVVQNIPTNTNVATQIPVQQIVEQPIQQIVEQPVQFGGIPNIQNHVDPESIPVDLSMNTASTPLNAINDIASNIPADNIPITSINPIETTSVVDSNQGLNSIPIPGIDMNNEENNANITENPFAVNNKDNNIFNNPINPISSNIDTPSVENKTIDNNSLTDNIFNATPVVSSDVSNVVSNEKEEVKTNVNLNASNVEMSTKEAINIMMESNSEIAELLAKTAKVILDNNEKLRTIIGTKTIENNISNENTIPLNNEQNTASSIFDSQTGGLNPQSLEQIPGFNMNKAA